MNNLLKDFKIQPTKLRGDNMEIKQKALDGANEITHDTKTGITTTTLVHTFRPCIDLFDGNGHIAHYETDTEFIEDFKRMKQENQKNLNDYCRLDARMKTQQKEFIKYLEDEIVNCYTTIPDYEVYITTRREQEILKEILSKYKEIVGDK